MANSQDAEEVEDYMTMAIAEPKKGPESSAQRAARARREGIARGQIPSRAELARREEAKREAALDRPIDASNKGFKMMQKLGFKGGALGKAGSADNPLTEPIVAALKSDKAGIGSSKKRKAPEAPDDVYAKMDGKTKDAKLDEYRSRKMQSAKNDRAERDVKTAMRTLRDLDESRYGAMQPDTPLREVNLLWRPLVASAPQSKKQKLRKPNDNELQYGEDEEEESLAWAGVTLGPDLEDESSGDVVVNTDVVQEDDTDEELQEFVALEPEERLARIADQLRAVHKFCLWCSLMYHDRNQEDCPGPDQADHE